MSDDDLTATRRAKLQELRAAGGAYPNDFRPEHRASRLHAAFATADAAALEGARPPARIAGRIVGKRSFGQAMFVVVDDRVLPTRHEVTIRGAEVVVQVERRCAIEVALADATLADRIACRDAAGKGAWIARMHGAGMEAGTTLPLHEGRSGTFVVGERAAMLLLLRGDTVVREVAIAPTPDRALLVQ